MIENGGWYLWNFGNNNNNNFLGLRNYFSFKGKIVKSEIGNDVFICWIRVRE